MKFPLTRLRRLRTDQWMRDMVAEFNVTPSDLVYPMFVIEGKNKKEEIKSMPGIFRMSVDLIIEETKKAADLGIPMIALFPAIDISLKSDDGKEAFNENNLISRCVKAIKKTVPDIGIMGDVALDPYTLHGHDGIVEGEDVHNDKTVAALIKQSLVLAKAGIDVIAPSDMMDGRIMMIRNALEENGYHNVKIMSYGVKYATQYYGPFRDAVGSKRSGYLNKATYQLDPRCLKQALNEVNMDVNEGADMVIIKPGTPYLDIIQRVSQEVRIPIFAYQVSGEYSAVKYAAEKGIFDYEKTILELLVGFKRAGCTGILTYAALDIAKYLRG